MSKVFVISILMVACAVPTVRASEVDEQFEMATRRCEALGYKVQTAVYQECVREQLRLIAVIPSGKNQESKPSGGSENRPPSSIDTTQPKVTDMATAPTAPGPLPSYLIPPTDGVNFFRKNAPPFPVDARRRLLFGEAIVKITIAETGLSSCTIESSTGFQTIDNSILAWCVKAPKFSPATRNSIPEPFSFKMKYGFSYKNSFGAEFASLLRKAESGDVDSQYKLGMNYRLGAIVDKSPDEAVKWIRMAADKGDPRAKAVLGEMYYEGFGVGKDYAEAARWSQIAAKLGVDSAQVFLAQLYFRGQGVERSYPEGEQWLRAAAAQDNRLAHSLISKFYSEGVGRDPDKKRALGWMYLAGGKDGERSESYGAAIKKLVADLDKDSIAWAKENARQCRNSKFKECAL